MKNNIVKSKANNYARQISGTAMGKPPAPCWANIFEGILKKEFSPLWHSFLPTYKRLLMMCMLCGYHQQTYHMKKPKPAGLTSKLM